MPAHSERMDTWSLRGTLAAAAVAVAIAGLGGAASYAAAGSYGHLTGVHGPAPGHPAHDRPGLAELHGAHR